MKEHWQIGHLEEVVKSIDYRGRTPEKTEYGLRLITAKNVKMGYLQNDPMEFIDPKKYDQWMTRGIPKKGDVLFTTEAPLGNVTQLDTDEKVVFAQRIIIMQPDREVLDSTFLKYMLLSKFMQDRIHAKGTGATVKGIKSQLLKKIIISFPHSLLEQKRIESIDIAIENTKKNLTNACELFENYLNAIFTHKDNGWENQRLGDIAEAQSGGTPLRSKNEYWGGDMAWYSSGELNDLYTVMPERKITELGIKNSNAKSFPKGSLLIGMYDTAALKMSILDREASFNQAIAGAKPNSEIDLTFILHAINAVKPELLNLRRGVRQKNLSLQKIKDIVIAVPELQEQKKVVRQLVLINAETQRLEIIYQEKLAALIELKQSILQKAFTGELTADSTNQTTKKAKEVIAA